MKTRTRAIQALACATIAGTIWRLWVMIVPFVYHLVYRGFPIEYYFHWFFFSIGLDFAAIVMAGTVAIRTLLKRRRASALCWTTVALLVINLWFSRRWLFDLLSNLRTLAPQWSDLQFVLVYVVPFVLVAFRLSCKSSPQQTNKQQIQHTMNESNMNNGSNTEIRDSSMKAPGTEPPDGSAVGLETVGQVHITVGWILFLVLGIIGCVCLENLPPIGFVCIGLAFICLVRGYTYGAKAKATAKAAIEAAKAAERTARMEQMLVNMVDGGGQVAQSQQRALVRCPKCGAMISDSAKFCPECGASAKTNCAKCGTEITPGVKFCPECGAEISPKSKLLPKCGEKQE